MASTQTAAPTLSAKAPREAKVEGSEKEKDVRSSNIIAAKSKYLSLF